MTDAARWRAEADELRKRLEEAEETLCAIRQGAVDALVVSESGVDRVYSLEGAERPYRRLVEQMQQGAVTLYEDGAIAYCNLRLATLLDVPHPRLIGVTLSDFIVPDERPLYEAFLREGRLGVSQGELGMLRSDGVRIPVYLTVSALAAAGAATVMVLITDLTAQKAHEQLAAAQEALREADRRKDEFLATLAHELRTPLNSILGWSVMLRSAPVDDGAVSQAVEVIERNARAQVRLIEDLLDISRIITGKLQLDTRPMDLASVIRGAGDAVRPSATAKDIRLDLALDPAVGLVLGDADRLQQVIVNLLSNAVKFTPEKGSIQVRLQRVGSTAEVVVSDTGCGIAPDVLPYVFDRFRQGDTTTTRRHGGLGLGLAIVKYLVESHGGDVRASSDGLDRGATFVVALPLLEPVTADAGGAARIAAARVAAAATPGAAPSLAGMRLLVIDDDAETRELFQQLFTGNGAAVTLAASAAQALAQLPAARPDVIVCDVEMPGGDGYEFIRRLRSLPAREGGTTPAVAVTVYGSVNDRIRLLAAGFQTHVPKPVEPTELLAVVASVAGRGGA